jgi:hypothetical protein
MKHTTTKIKCRTTIEQQTKVSEKVLCQTTFTAVMQHHTIMVIMVNVYVQMESELLSFIELKTSVSEQQCRMNKI